MIYYYIFAHDRYFFCLCFNSAMIVSFAGRLAELCTPDFGWIVEAYVCKND